MRRGLENSINIVTARLLDGSIDLFLRRLRRRL
jgi:hypothetical protein